MSRHVDAPSYRPVFNAVRREVAASWVVFLVALPLSLGVPLASGAPLMSGLIAAAVGGLVAGALGGAPLMVSGPAAGMTVVVFTTIERFGFATTCAITAAAGVLQILLGLARVARLATAITPAVLQGMLAGIGVLIASAQLQVALGAAPASSLAANLLALPANLAAATWPPVLVALVTGIILVAWPRLPTRRLGVPAAVVGIAVAACMAQLGQLDLPRVQLPQGMSLPDLSLQGYALSSLAAAAISMALIASAESLLGAVAVDKLHDGTRANLNRELVGQGMANFISGLLGGLAVTGVIVRSTANVEAGSRSRASTMLHGLWILLAISTLRPLLEMVPLAALAALLILVGLKLLQPQQTRALVAKGEGPVLAVTFAGVVGINLLAGIGLGLAVASLRLLIRLSQAQVRILPPANLDQAWQVEIRGAATFLLVPRLLQALAEVPQGSRVQLQLQVLLLDHAAHEALHSWRALHIRQGGEVTWNERPLGLQTLPA